LPLHFNLSRSNGFIVCLVALHREIGVDVEDTERPSDILTIADHFYSRPEIAALRALPEEVQRIRFFEYWTLKEAYIKARGMGMSLPLDQFSFHLEPSRPVRVSFDHQLKDNALTWEFGQFRPTARHMIAVAIRREAGADLKICVNELHLSCCSHGGSPGKAADPEAGDHGP
jgi:4'-phosphopantetheinyl transferase